MADTTANRLATGWKVYLADALSGTTRVNFPDITGTAITWGTAWPQLPSPSNEPEIKVSHKTEAFRPAFYMHDTDADIVETGTESISFEIKETDIDALALGLGTSISGSVASGSGSATWQYLLEPQDNADITMKQIGLQRIGPAGGWGQVTWLPNVKRAVSDFVKPVKGKIGTLKLTFDVFAATTDIKIDKGGTAGSLTCVPEGACGVTFEYVTLGTA